jgi:oligopeptide/dipeptide ABC transporter ATP-binding protein
VSGDPLLRIQDLRVWFQTRTGAVRAVDGVDLEIRRSEIIGLVGESGSGKSVTARAIMRLVPMPPGKLVSGSILFDGEDLITFTERQMEELRGGRIAMIFQDPMTFLNPLYTAGDQVAEAIRRHQGLDRAAARAEVIRLFREVGIPSPERRYDAYPHQLSGGLRQRVMIAMALSSRPALLIADEPTTALDVTIQAQILALLRDLQQSSGMSILLITHDLGVVAEMCDRVAVMYAGRIVEQAPIDELFDQPQHPYTVGLMNAIPRPDLPGVAPRPIEGAPPDMAHPPSGCPFHPRCPYREPVCLVEMPAMRSVGAAHRAACHFAGIKPFTPLAAVAPEAVRS